MSLTVATIEDVERVVGDALARRDGVHRVAWTVPEVAKSLGTSPDSVRKLIKAGVLPIVPHMGTRQLVPVLALEAFVSAGASTSAGAASLAGVDGPADSIGATTPRGSGSDVLPLRPQGVGGPDPTASPGASGDAA